MYVIFAEKQTMPITREIRIYFKGYISIERLSDAVSDPAKAQAILQDILTQAQKK